MMICGFVRFSNAFLGCFVRFSNAILDYFVRFSNTIMGYFVRFSNKFIAKIMLFFWRKIFLWKIFSFVDVGFDN